MLRQMRDEGLDLEACIRVFEAAERKADPTNAARQARHRAKRKASEESNAVTVTRDTVSPKEDQTPSGTNLPDEADASSPIRQPITEALAIWNRNAAEAGWPMVKTMSANRDRLLAARLRQHGLEGWQAAIAKARGSEYLSGADPPSWFTFPWLIKSENFLKLSEGNYDNRHRQDRPAASGWEAAYRANLGTVGHG